MSCDSQTTSQFSRGAQKIPKSQTSQISTFESFFFNVCLFSPFFLITPFLGSVDLKLNCHSKCHQTQNKCNSVSDSLKVLLQTIKMLPLLWFYVMFMRCLHFVCNFQNVTCRVTFILRLMTLWVTISFRSTDPSYLCKL